LAGLAASPDSEVPEAAPAIAAVGLGCLALGLLAVVLETSHGAKEVRKWEAEVARLETIGRQRGWVYLGRYIPDPTQTINVNVQEDPASAFGAIIGGLLRGLAGQP